MMQLIQKYFHEVDLDPEGFLSNLNLKNVDIFLLFFQIDFSLIVDQNV